ncbi:MAG: hypothetical protein M3O24_03040 [Thermoproteota archaeon]|nr:hypothetical protein [Thermoproteota archaeon]
MFSFTNSIAVILDYKMPDRNRLEVAKEILATNCHQRIIFVSAFVEEWLFNSIKELKIPVEVLQKTCIKQSAD